MPTHLNPPRRRLLLAMALAAVPAPAFAQSTATWLSPASGSWDTAARWSTNAVPGPGASALIAATGSPYTVTAATTITADRLDLSSPNATLDVRQGIAATAVYLSAGTATFHGSALNGTALRGTLPLTVDTNAASFTNLTLATTLRGITQPGPGLAFKYLDFYNSLSLDGGTLALSPSLCAAFHDNFSVAGTGTLTAEGEAYAYLAGSAPSLTFAPGITLATTPAGASIDLHAPNNLPASPILYNHGTLAAQTPGLTLSVGYDTFFALDHNLQVLNTGTLVVSNGGTLKVGLANAQPVGNISLGPAGTLYLSGPNYTLDHPLTVDPTSVLKLNGGWKTGATLTLDASTLSISTGPSAPCTIQYLNAPTVELTDTVSAPTLPLLNTTPSTRIVPTGTLDLAGASFSFASVPGQWSFPAASGPETPSPAGWHPPVHATLKNGSLPAGVTGNDLVPNGGAVNLSNVTLNFPLDLTQGVVQASSNTTFAQPVSLSGTGRLILSSFSNPAGISATAGTLELRSLPASPGAISLSGTSTLELDFATTLTQSSSLPFGSPATLAVGPQGSLDLQSATLDLSSSHFQLALAGDTGGAILSNGTLTDPSHSHPLRVSVGIPGSRSYLGQLSNVSCSADVSIDPLATLRLFNSSLHNSHLTGGGTLDYGPASSSQTVVLDNVTLDNVTLHVHSNSPLTVTNTLSINTPFSIDPGSTVDLTTATLLLNYATAAQTIRPYLLSHQLLSSLSDTTHSIGYAPFSAGPTGPTSLLVKLTLIGDANLDGKLTPDDYTLLDRGYATSGSTWSQGDFNYDGIINNQDYLLIDTVYGKTHGLSPNFLSQRESQFGPTYVSDLLASIPEPASPLACLFAKLLLPRRRPR